MPTQLFLILAQVLRIYTVILLIRIILSWVMPYQNWHKQPMAVVFQLTEPIMEPFRRMIPPVGGLDLSPMLLFIVIQLLEGLLQRLAYMGF